MNISVIQNKVNNVRDMQKLVTIKMIDEIRNVINDQFNGNLDFMDYETDDDDIWSPTLCWCDDFSDFYEDYHVGIITCETNGDIILDLENEETINIEECTFDEVYEIYVAVSNICDHLN